MRFERGFTRITGAPTVRDDPYRARRRDHVVELAADGDARGDLPRDRVDAVEGAGARRRPQVRGDG
jgi:hypothetical protein